MDSTHLRIYCKTISHLSIREDILSHSPSDYAIGPTIIWTEDPGDLSIFTHDTLNYIGFESPFNKPSSPKYLVKIIRKMRMKKGTILIKEATPKDAMHIPVHFCAYCVDGNGRLTIFDPSWHSADPGIYSTSAFYDSLDAFKITYQHAHSDRTHHWQSLLPNDVFCQTWTLQWLMQLNTGVKEIVYPLPRNCKEAAQHIAKYMKELSRIVLKNRMAYMSVFPTYKLENHAFDAVFRHICGHMTLAKYIHDKF